MEDDSSEILAWASSNAVQSLDPFRRRMSSLIARWRNRAAVQQKQLLLCTRARVHNTVLLLQVLNLIVLTEIRYSDLSSCELPGSS